MKSRLKIFFLLAAMAVPLAARCGDLQKEYDATRQKSAKKGIEFRPHDEVNAVQHEITEVGLERVGTIFTGSEVYTVIIKFDGSFSYTGGKNSKHPGSHTGHIATNEISPLFQYVREIDFFSLDDAYAVGATDQDQVYIMAAKAGERKIISNYGNGGPLKLWALEQVIDSMLANAAWDDAK